MTLPDRQRDTAAEQVVATLRGAIPAPRVTGFFDEITCTASYVVDDPETKVAAIIDGVLDFDPAAGRISTASADDIIAYVRDRGLRIEWLLETHVHADHLSSAAYLQRELGGQIAIGREISAVQAIFGEVFNENADFARDGLQFDRLFDDGDAFSIGRIPVVALHVPGHTPADLAYVIGDAVFVGDTLFMPDYGTARADFPGGCARTLYRSIRRLMHLPGSARVFVGHDYKAPGRDCFAWESTIGAQRAGNIHVHGELDEEAFVAMRNSRDATLATPRLMLPSVQINMRAGHPPAPEANGVRYLKLPLNLAL